jgi:MFS superfamily sulfate permease-like transporter
VLHGKTNWVTFAIGAATLAVILLLKDKKRVPGILIAVAGATVAVGVLDLASHNVAILGSLPQGLPAFAIPWITTDDIVPVIIGGCAVALVSFADTSVLSRVYAARTIPTSTRTRRWWGSVSPIWRAGCSRLPDQQQFIAHPRGRSSGARTQLAGVVGALAVAVLLMVAPDLLHNLPTSALAAVVIASAIGLIEVTDLLRITVSSVGNSGSPSSVR